jgi:hypothetical protein
MRPPRSGDIEAGLIATRLSRRLGTARSLIVSALGMDMFTVYKILETQRASSTAIAPRSCTRSAKRHPRPGPNRGQPSFVTKPVINFRFVPHFGYKTPQPTVP